MQHITYLFIALCHHGNQLYIQSNIKSIIIIVLKTLR